ncbi:S1/P1 nuclease [Sesbania bispinosa]|nr:S1/P1 nuclease [Sesbania bispinosa]
MVFCSCLIYSLYTVALPQTREAIQLSFIGSKGSKNFTIYASESSQDACKWAYKDAPDGSVLEGDYFESRYPIVNLRLAQGGVRLAATLNRIFDSQFVMSM